VGWDDNDDVLLQAFEAYVPDAVQTELRLLGGEGWVPEIGSNTGSTLTAKRNAQEVADQSKAGNAKGGVAG